MISDNFFWALMITSACGSLETGLIGPELDDLVPHLLARIRLAAPAPRSRSRRQPVAA
jgi:hypothetical protein